ncbi:MAG: AAA domain-containing protein [Bacteroidota bacterium]
MQKEINAALEQIQNLLKKEKEEDLERYRRQQQELTLTEKLDRGLCWHPLQVKKEGYTFGERAFVTVERTTRLNEAHQMRAGAPVDLYSGAVDKFSKSEKMIQSGVIYFVDKNRMKIILNAKDLPDWLHHGHLGVDLLFDERTYLEMDKALMTLMQNNDGRIGELKALFYGHLTPKFRGTSVSPHPYLNEAQQTGVRYVLESQDVAVIHGPPGTGKTTTLVQAIQELCRVEKQVLVTAPSNAAVDLLAERLTEKGVGVVRIGNISRVDEKLLALTVEQRLSNHPESKNIKKVRIEAATARREARRFKRKFGQNERHERREAYRLARELEDWAKHLEDRVISEILHSAQVIACTLVNATHRIVADLKFRTVVIDEAAQALEAATWIPILKAHKVVLAGDPFQLPPTVKSQEARRAGLGLSLLEKWVKQSSATQLLDVQYRMHQTIMGFSNARFYQGALKADATVANWQLSIPQNDPFVFIDTAGCGFDEAINPESKSRFNKGEYFIFREYFLQMVAALAEADAELPSMAIISPYREQCQYMKEELAEEESLQNYLPHLDINTIDAFQGQERDVIFISLVRSNERSEIGFLADYRRMNVAMTRARKQLIVIGDSATIAHDDFYAAFLDYVEQKGTYTSAWTYMS